MEITKLNKKNVQDMIALTPFQEGILFRYLIDPESGEYCENLCINISGEIQYELVEKAWNIVIETNEMLRSVFRWKKTKNPIQIILKKKEVDIKFYDFVSKKRKQECYERIIKENEDRRFDLQQETFRVLLCMIDKSEYKMIISNHHIIMDGWSTGIILKEFLDAYEKLEKGIEPIKQCKIRFKEYRKWLNKQDENNLEFFWKKTFEGFIPHQTYELVKNEEAYRKIESCQSIINDEFANYLNMYTKNHGVTLASLIYTAWGILLHKYSGVDDVVFGTTVSGRNITLDGIQDMVGLFINTIPLRVIMNETDDVSEIVQRVSATIRERENYEITQITDIKSAIGLKGDEMLFNSIVVIENYPINNIITNYSGKFKMHSYSIDEKNSFDLTLSVIVSKVMSFKFDYDTRIFNNYEAQNVLSHLKFILYQMVKYPEKGLCNIDILTSEENKLILYDYNSSYSEYPRNKTLHQLFEEQVEKTPESMAVEFGGSKLTYAQLNEKANKLARTLKKNGIGHEDIVGIMVEHSLEMVIGCLAILKSEGTYLPIDIEYPGERISYILKDSHAKAMLTISSLKGKIDYDGSIIAIDSDVAYDMDGSNLEKKSNPDSLAYCIYTSGSTGIPKGVMVEHRSVVNYISWAAKTYLNGRKFNFPLYTSLAFDLTVTSIFTPLITGNAVIVYKNDNKGVLLEKIIDENKVGVIKLTPSHLKLIRDKKVSNSNIKVFILGGEALENDLARDISGNFNHNVEIFNEYGPTEATVGSMIYKFDPIEDVNKFTSIGSPVDNMKIYILDKNLKPLPVGIVGEIYISGDGVSRGYLNKPELTKERFVLNPFLEKDNDKMYKTGDLGKFISNNDIEFIGRIDNQIKLRGYRVELGDIENKLLKHIEISESVVILKENSVGEKYLSAYFVSSKDLTVDELRKFLLLELPEYMLPSFFIRVDKIPLTINGKVDKEFLPEPGTLRPTLSQNYIRPKTDLHIAITEIWKEVLGIGKVGINDKFFEVGGNSLNAIRIKSRIEELVGKDISITVLFKYPTIAELAEYLENDEKSHEQPEYEVHNNKDYSADISNSGIAIIGMSGRFPGANSIDKYWKNIKSGIESISFFTEEELLESGIDPQIVRSKNYVKAKGILDNMEYFDNSFFGYTPSEVKIMDPQLRILHECAWEAMESSGYDIDRYEDAIGLYVGATSNIHWVNNLLNKVNNLSEEFHAASFNDVFSFSTRISYNLNLKGPAVSLQTACSTSLVAVHMACKALKAKECRMALAGGVSVTLPQKSGYIYQEGMVKSKDGHCRAFDADAKGIIGGDGVGIVVLKSVEDAINDGDYIYAVIKGSAINNDGRRKVGYTAPSTEGQEEVIKMALNEAGFEPESISYVETHGTGTVIGDPIEIEALTKAFNTHNKSFCGIGSVKTNIGHLDAAAGIAGLIKTALSLKHRMIPPIVNFNSPNPEIDFNNSPFYINDKLSVWESDFYPLRAGVSSFGIGGTNAHLILEEAPEVETLANDNEWQLLPLTAKSHTALNSICEKLARHLQLNPNINIADLAYTLQIGRKNFSYRRFLVCNSVEDILRELHSISEEKTLTVLKEEKKSLVFVFKGKSNLGDYIGYGLYKTESSFREDVSKCLNIVKKLTGHNLLQISYDNANYKDIEQSEVLMLIFEYCLAKLMIRWGIKPKAMIGEGLGEVIVACLSEVLSLQDALELIIFKSNSAKEFDKLSSPRIPFISNLTGSWITDAEALDPMYWRKYAGHTEGFSKGINVILNLKEIIFVQFSEEKELVQLNNEKCTGRDDVLFVNISKFENKYADDKLILLKRVGDLWIKGIDINWNALHSTKRHRITLPTYSFDRKYYGLNNEDTEYLGTKKTIENDSSKLSNEKNEFNKWFYIPLWKQSDHKFASKVKKEISSTWVVFDDEYGLGSKITSALKKDGNIVINIRMGIDFSKEDQCIYTINPKDKKDYEKLTRDLKESRIEISNIANFWGVKGKDGFSIEKSLGTGFYSMIYLADALNRNFQDTVFNIWAITDNIYDLGLEKCIYPENATMLGACLVIPQEYPKIKCRNIDITLSEKRYWKEDYLIKMFINDFSEKRQDISVAYRETKRWVQEYERLEIENLNIEESVLKKNGVYLITGGLGNIGLILAEYLVETVGAKVIIVGRSVFPMRKDWKKWIETHPKDDDISRKIKKLIEIEEKGSAVELYSSDISNFEQMQYIVKEVDKNFGEINGVIHAAGITGNKSYSIIRDLDRDYCEEHFSSKVYGTIVLEKLFQGRNLDFCILISSLSSILGGTGFAAYSAANLFMDTFVKRHNRLNTAQWTSVNLEVPYEEPSVQKTRIIEKFKNIFAMSDLGQVVISSEDLQPKINKWVNCDLDYKNIKLSKREQNNPWNPPILKREKELVKIWEEFFGIQPIGITDNFYDLGGDSLKAISVVTKIHNELGIEVPVMEFFNRPTVKQLAEYMEKLEVKEPEIDVPLEPVPKKQYYMLSSAQRRSYIQYLMNPANTALNETVAFHITGDLDFSRVDKVIKGIIERHEILRTTIEMIDDEPMQKIHPYVDFEIERFECKEEDLELFMDEFVKPFDLGKAPFVRICIMELAQTKHIMVVDMHHILTDRVSHEIFVRDFIALYKGDTLPQLKIQYKDYSEWQNSKGWNERVKQEEYWMEQLSGEIPQLKIPLDFERPSRWDFSGGNIHFEIDAEHTSKIKKFISDNEITHYILLLSVYNILLMKYSGQEEIIVGSPITGRVHSYLENLIGMFVNMLSMRNFPVGQKRVDDFIKEVKHTALLAYENQSYQYDEIVAKLGIKRKTSRNPLFDVVFSFQGLSDFDIKNIELDNLKLAPLKMNKNIAQFDLLMIGTEVDNRIDFVLEYPKAMLKEATAQRIVEHYKEILYQVIDNPYLNINDISISMDLVDIKPSLDEELDDFLF